MSEMQRNTVKGNLLNLLATGSIVAGSVLGTGCAALERGFDNLTGVTAQQRRLDEINRGGSSGNTGVGGMDEYERRTVDSQVLGMHGDLANQRGNVKMGAGLGLLGALNDLDKEIDERRRLERLRKEQGNTLRRIEENSTRQNNNSTLIVPQQNALDFRFREYSEISDVARRFQVHHYAHGFQIGPAYKEIKPINGAVKYPESFVGLSTDFKEGEDFKMLFGGEKYWKDWYFMISEVIKDKNNNRFVKRIEQRGRVANHGVIGIGPNGDVRLSPGIYQIEGNAGDMIEPSYSHSVIVRINP